MIRNKIFDECLSNVSPATIEEVNLSFEIAKRIQDIMKTKGMKRSELAAKLGKKPAEISRWLNGTHNFTISTVAKLSVALESPIISIYTPVETNPVTVFIRQNIYYETKSSKKGSYKTLIGESHDIKPDKSTFTSNRICTYRQQNPQIL